MTVKAWVIYNPNAGRFPSRALVERAARGLQSAGWEITVRQSSSPRDLTHLAVACAAHGCDALFVAGGDGTVGKAVQGLAGTETALGVLPTGTANVFAQELGLPRLGYTDWFALAQTVRRLAAGRVARVDAGRCNGEVFMLWAGVGLDGHVISRVEPRSRLVKLLAVPSYVALSTWAARDWRGVDLRVSVDGQSMSGRYSQVIVSNIQSYGGGLFWVAREARLDDGLLDLWLFEGDSFADSLSHVFNLLSGKHLRDPRVTSFTGKSIVLEAAQPSLWQMDGEGYGRAAHFEINIWPQALKVLLPERLGRQVLSPSTLQSLREQL